MNERLRGEKEATLRRYILKEQEYREIIENYSRKIK